MFVASKKGSSNILHNQQCFYGKRIRTEDGSCFILWKKEKKRDTTAVSIVLL